MPNEAETLVSLRALAWVKVKDGVSGPAEAVELAAVELLCRERLPSAPADDSHDFAADVRRALYAYSTSHTASGDMYDAASDAESFRMANARAKASRPPGEAEPGLREAMAGIAEKLLAWGGSAPVCDGGEGGEALGYRVAHKMLSQALRAGDGAAPPQPTECHSTLATVTGTGERVAVSGMRGLSTHQPKDDYTASRGFDSHGPILKSPEPSGVPDAPGLWLRVTPDVCGGVAEYAEDVYKRPDGFYYRSFEQNGASHEHPVSEACWLGRLVLEGRRTPDADAGAEGLRKRVLALAEEIPAGLGLNIDEIISRLRSLGGES